jgi:hypothetical protein
MEQNYLIISNNIVENIVLWGGNPNWILPSNSIALSQNDTPSIKWALNSTKTDYELIEFLGFGDIGDTWDGSKLTTNQPKPKLPISPIPQGMTSV